MNRYFDDIGKHQMPPVLEFDEGETSIRLDQITDIYLYLV